MPNLRNSSKGGFEPGLSRLRVRHSTTELTRSTQNVEEPKRSERSRNGYHKQEIPLDVSCYSIAMLPSTDRLSDRAIKPLHPAGF